VATKVMNDSGSFTAGGGATERFLGAFGGGAN
jgi:hypothetical protein